jgi:hypothetical protein
MDKDPREQQESEIDDSREELMDRRGFLLGLKKWSKIVIGGAILGGALLNSATETEAAGWANRAGGGGAWANRAGGGGAWANRAGGGAVVVPGGGGAWVNRGAAWANRGGSWVNRF